MAAPIVPGFVNIRIDASEFSAAIWALGPAFDVEAAIIIEKAMDQAGEIVQRAVRKRARRHYRTGRLERQVRVLGVGAGWDRIVRVRSEGSVAHLVAGRVRPHAIRSREPETKAMPLYVRGGITGWSEAVQHPGTRGDPYFHVGAMNSRLAINAVLKKSARLLAQHLAIHMAQVAGRAAKGQIP
jgi:hypothetical protein